MPRRFKSDRPGMVTIPDAQDDPHGWAEYALEAAVAESCAELNAAGVTDPDRAARFIVERAERILDRLPPAPDVVTELLAPVGTYARRPAPTPAQWAQVSMRLALE